MKRRSDNKSHERKNWFSLLRSELGMYGLNISPLNNSMQNISEEKLLIRPGEENYWKATISVHYWTFYCCFVISTAPGSQPCAVNNGNCSDLCLLTPGRGRKCACPQGVALSADGMTCKNGKKSTSKILKQETFRGKKTVNSACFVGGLF